MAQKFLSGIRLTDGTASAPSLSFSGDSNTGIYWSTYSGTSKQLNISTDGSVRASFNTAGVTSNANFYTSAAGSFRNYSGVWKATTGITGNGFQFITVDSTALTISSTGDANFAGDIDVNSFVEIGEDGTYPTNYGAVGFGGRTNGYARIFGGLTNKNIYITSGTGGDIKFRVNGTSTNVLDIESDGNATFAGRVMADTHFQSSDTNATLSATGNGNIYLRPNGYSTTTGQVHIDTSGNATFAGTVKAATTFIADAVDGTNADPGTDNVRVSGYGMIGNRANLYITNSSTSSSANVQIGVGGVHNGSPKLVINPGSSIFYTDIKASADSTHDIGTSASRFANIYADTLYGDGSNLTNLPSQISGLATENYVDTAVANVVDTAPEALNTLNELAAALGDDAAFSTTVSTALGNRVRVDTASQGLNSTQKSNARTNIGAGTSSFDGVYSSLSSIPTSFTPAQHTQAISTITGLQTALDGKNIFQGSYSAGYTGDMDSLTGFRVIRSTSGSNRAFSAHHNVITIPNTGSSQYGAQLAFETGTVSDGGIKFRNSTNGTFTSWYRLYHEGHLPTLSELGAQAALSAQDLTDIGNLSGTNTGDQDLSGYLTTGFSDYVSKANGGTFDGNIAVQDISMGADDRFTHGSYLELSYGASNTSQFTFNADYDGGQTGTYTPHYSGTSGSGMSIVKMPSGGVGGLDFFVKNHGTTTGSHNISTFTKILELNQNGASTFAGNVTAKGDIIIDNSSGDPFLKLKTTAQEYVIRIDQSDSEKFQIRDITNSATRLTITTAGDANFGGNISSNGTISATNFSGSSSGTNTGDQDLSGYLTSYSETDTLDTVCDRGAITDQTIKSTNGLGFRVDSSASARIEIENGGSNWAYLRLRDDSTVSWDIASYNGGDLELRPAGSGTNGYHFNSSGVFTSGDNFTSTKGNTAYDWGDHDGLYIPVGGGQFSGALDFTPDTGAILKVDNQTIIERTTANGGLTIGHDDSIILAGGDTSSTLNNNITNSEETVFIGAEGGLKVFAFPNNMSGGWSAREEWSFANNGVTTFPGNTAVGTAKYTLTVNSPSGLTTTIVNNTINVTFTASTTTNIDYYLVFSSVDGGDYGLISVIPPADFGATMSIIDDSFDVTGTQAYRVYAVKNGVYSSALTGSRAYAVTSAEPTNMSVVNLNKAYYVQWDPPSSNARFVTAYNVYKHEHATQGSLLRSSATLIYSGLNTSYMYSINGANNTNFHQFWVETTIA